MSNKYIELTKIYKEKINEVTKDIKSWQEFLKCASYHFKYNFENKLLIYAQNPSATACATMQEWNSKKELHRWIIKNAKSIAIIDENSNKIKLIFDVKDTHHYNDRNYNLWQYDEKHEEKIIESLESKFGKLEMKDNITDAIISATYISIEDNIQDYLSELVNFKENSRLEELDKLNIEVEFRELLVASVAYMALKRCNINAEDILNDDYFRNLYDFNNTSVKTILGKATSDIAENIITEIRDTIKNLKKDEKNKNYRIENETEKEYNQLNKNERSENNATNNLSQSGRLSSTKFNNEGTANANREIRKNETSISKAEQTINLFSSNDGRQIDTTSRGNTEFGYEKSTRNNPTNEQGSEHNRRIKGEKSDGVGWKNEQPKEFSRGNSNTGDNLQLSFLTEQEQINNIQNQVENENSTFSFSQEEIDNVLQEGSGFSEGKYRIYRQYENNSTTKENAEFLKHEYGIGGSGGYNGINFWHDAKGIKLNRNTSENNNVMTLNWNQVATRIGIIIKEGRYLNDEEKVKYNDWIYTNLKEGVLDNPKLSLEERLLEFETDFDIYDTTVDGDSNEQIDRTIDDINYEIATPKDIFETKNYYNAILKAEDDETSELSIYLKGFINEFDDLLIQKSNLKSGSIVYLNDTNNKKYIVDEMSNQKVSLLDYDLYLNRQMIFREINYADFRKLFLEQELNFINNESKNKETNNKLNSQNKISKVNDEIKINYKITDNKIGEGSPKEKYSKNIKAIRVLKKLEDEKRLATNEEQQTLSDYVGWGGIPEVFDQNNSSWSEEYKELKELLSSEEYNQARASTLTAFYTPPIVIKSIYKALENMGFIKGNILEPACGTGNFMGLIPNSLNNCKMYGVELDIISGKIAKQLYQKNNIKVTGFENTNLPNSFFDVAIGNVPFGDFKITDKKYDKYNFLIHDYFFAKSIDQVRPRWHNSIYYFKRDDGQGKS